MWFDFIIIMFYRILYELNANSVDPDQMPHSAASDPGLLLPGARLKWVNIGIP